MRERRVACNEEDCRVPAHYGKERKQTLEAHCPFCGIINDDEHERGEKRTTCKHFVYISGGCGAYIFVFKKKGGE